MRMQMKGMENVIDDIINDPEFTVAKIPKRYRFGIRRRRIHISWFNVSKCTIDSTVPILKTPVFVMLFTRTKAWILFTTTTHWANGKLNNICAFLKLDYKEIGTVNKNQSEVSTDEGKLILETALANRLTGKRFGRMENANILLLLYEDIKNNVKIE